MGEGNENNYDTLIVAEDGRLLIEQEHPGQAAKRPLC